MNGIFSSAIGIGILSITYYLEKELNYLKDETENKKNDYNIINKPNKINDFVKNLSKILGNDIDLLERNYRNRMLIKKRSEQIKNIFYDLFIKLSNSDFYSGEIFISFKLLNNSVTFLNFNGNLVSLIINNTELSEEVLKELYIKKEGKIYLPSEYLIKGVNIISIKFKGTYSNNVGLVKVKEEDESFIYLMGESMNASKVFPCFDQPNLKANFIIKIDCPIHWTAISSLPIYSSSRNKDSNFLIFKTTPEISTYLLALNAGPFFSVKNNSEEIYCKYEMTLYCMPSYKELLIQQKNYFFELQKNAIDYCEKYFNCPYQFNKYEQILMKDFVFYASENLGATLSSADKYLFKGTAITEIKKIRRSYIQIHEIVHHWMGNIITIETWDDLWLKEGFAVFLAYKALIQDEKFSKDRENSYICYSFYKFSGIFDLIDSNNHALFDEENVPAFENSNNNYMCLYDEISYAWASAIISYFEYLISDFGLMNLLRRIIKYENCSNIISSKIFVEEISKELKLNKNIFHDLVFAKG